MAQALQVVLWPFWNGRERRVRAGWRIAVFMLLIAASEFLTGWLGFRTSSLDAFVKTSVARFVASAIVVGGCTLLFDRRGFDALGWVPSPAWWADLGFGVFLGAALISGVVGVEWAVGWLTTAPARPGALAESLLKAVLLFVAAGAAEEFVFRSYLLRNLADGVKLSRLGSGVALLTGTVLSSAFFGAVHALNPNATAASVANIALAGVFLAAGYLLTGRLALPLGLHFAWNYFQGPVFGLPVSGIDLGRSALAFTQGGPEVWTGGAFGIEGGLLGLLAMLVGVMAIGIWVRWRYGALAPAASLLFPEPPPPPAAPPPELPQAPAEETPC